MGSHTFILTLLRCRSSIFSWLPFYQTSLDLQEINMKSVLAVLALATICSISQAAKITVPGVVSFNIDEEELNIYQILRESAPHKPSRLGAYRYVNCDKPGDLLNVTTLNFSPDPISFPGSLGVNFAADFKKTLDAPLKASIVLERKVGSTWIKIPCIGNIGSCTYDDLCELLQGADCPPPFGANGVPCKCPFTAGSYKLPNVSFDIDAAVFPPGDYHAKGTLTTGQSGEVSVGCIELYASFA